MVAKAMRMFKINILAPNPIRQNGKADRFVQTPVHEWASAQAYSLQITVPTTYPAGCIDIRHRPHSSLKSKPAAPASPRTPVEAPQLEPGDGFRKRPRIKRPCSYSPKIGQVLFSAQG